MVEEEASLDLGIDIVCAKDADGFPARGMVLLRRFRVTALPGLCGLAGSAVALGWP